MPIVFVVHSAKMVGIFVSFYAKRETALEGSYKAGRRPGP
jgi:hypothetical protein